LIKKRGLWLENKETPKVALRLKRQVWRWS